MTFSFEGPSSNLYPAITGAIIVGGWYSAIAETSPLPVVIFAIRELVDYIFYRLATLFFQASDDRSRAKIYAATNLTVNVATLFTLRYLGLIGKLGTQILLGIMVVEMMCKCFDFSKYQVEPVT